MRIEFFLILLWVAKLRGNPSTLGLGTHYHGMKEKYYWGIVDFKFPNASSKTEAILSGSFVPDNNVILAMEVWNEKIFVSLFRIGVVSALNYFSIDSDSKSPLLIPYPSFDANYVNEDPIKQTVSLPGSSSVISAGYLKIDKCNRLWVFDTGISAYYGNKRIISQPALVIFDLRTNTLVRRVIFPPELINSASVYSGIEIDLDGESCDDAYAYIGEMFRSVIVYSFKTNRSWRLVHSYFGSDPCAANMTYDGLNYQWNFGVYGLALGAHKRDGSRRLYISSMSSTSLYYISNSVLKNETYVALNNYFNDVHYLGDRGADGQLFALAYDTKTNVLFDTQIGRKSVGCWNAMTPFKNTTAAIVYKNENLFYPSDIMIDCKRNLWVFSNSLPTFFYGTWLSNAKNIRIFKQNVDEAISKTVCHCKRKPK